MNDLIVFCEQFFQFLEKQGYFITSNSENIVYFNKNLTNIEIRFEKISYELSCQFVANENHAFTLYDILSYGEFDGLKGSYQLRDKSQLVQGVKYLASVIQIVLRQYDVLDAEIFDELYEYQLQTREKLLGKYYFEQDMKLAEQFWKEKEYSKAKKMYEKHKENLSKVQNKRLKYLCKVFGVQ